MGSDFSTVVFYLVQGQSGPVSCFVFGNCFLYLFLFFFHFLKNLFMSENLKENI